MNLTDYLAGEMPPPPIGGTLYQASGVVLQLSAGILMLLSMFLVVELLQYLSINRKRIWAVWGSIYPATVLYLFALHHWSAPEDFLPRRIVIAVVVLVTIFNLVLSLFLIRKRVRSL